MRAGLISPPIVVLNDTSARVARTFVHNINIEPCLAKGLRHFVYRLSGSRITRTPHNNTQLVTTYRQLVHAHHSPPFSVDSDEVSEVLVEALRMSLTAVAYPSQNISHSEGE
jgi:hypothetical protein